MTLSGAPIILFEFARHLQRSGVFVTVMAPETGPLVAKYEAEDIPVFIDPHALADPMVSLHLYGAYDVTISNTVDTWRCVRAAKSINKPCLWLVHESEFGMEKLRAAGREAERALSQADVVVFPADLSRNLYRVFPHANPHLAIHYGIADLADESIPDSPFVRRPDSIHVVHAGSVEPRKGADVVLRALQLLPPDLAERIEVHFVGRVLAPDYAHKLQVEARGKRNVHFVGQVPREMVWAYMKHADIFVCTSREETGPIVVIEALALGKAVISTRVGAASEIINDGENGFVVDVDDYRALARRLATLVRDQDKITDLGLAARSTYEEHLKLRRYGRDLMAVLDRIVPGFGVEEAASVEAKSVAARTETPAVR